MDGTIDPIGLTAGTREGGLFSIRFWLSLCAALELTPRTILTTLTDLIRRLIVGTPQRLISGGKVTAMR